MKEGLRVIDSDLHVIENGEVYDTYLADAYRDKMPQYLGWSPTNFPHWDVQGQIIPPWARSEDVIGPQQFLDAPTEHLYKPVRERNYDAVSTLEAMDAEGIDVAVVYRTFAHMVVSIDDLEPACEDYGQAVVFNGGLEHAGDAFVLDNHHLIEKGRIFPVCGNTWRMLEASRFAPYFEFIGDFSTHYGIFPGCGTAIPYGELPEEARTSGCC